MSYITLTVFVAIAGLRCYWGMDRGRRRAWLQHQTQAADRGEEQQLPLVERAAD